MALMKAAINVSKPVFHLIMFDGSSCNRDENVAKTKELVKICAEKGMSLEAEVGSIGGEEDGVVGMGECADPDECKAIADLGVDMLAAGNGNIHASIRLTGLDSALRHWQLYRRRQVRCLSFFMAVQVFLMI